jgi:aminopeptidase N
MRAARFLFLPVFLFAAPAWAGAGIPHLELDLRLEPASRQLAAQASLDLQADQVDFTLLPSLKITRLSIDGRPQRPPAGNGNIHLDLAGSGTHQLQVSYQGALAPLADLDHREVLAHLPPMADAKGSFLPAGSGWYPDPGVPFSYRLRLQLPPGQKGLVPGTLVGESEITPTAAKGKPNIPPSSAGYNAEYLYSQAAEGIELMAGPYEVKERLIPRTNQTPLRLRTWFYPDMADLAQGYLDDSARYIARYSEAIGPYPFDAFSVVAAPLPTGFGMPSLTYLGRDVLRLPFIRATSLGHEVLHNWWGNGVIPDWATGNWSEGLTTFLADYAYKEDQSADAARDARLGWLRDLAAVPPSEDTSLTAFTARHHGISSIVGYDKAAMVFLMLRDEIGAQTFAKGLRLFWQRHRFLRAGWTDLEHDFGEAAGRDLGTFFRQWVQGAGAPVVRLVEARWDLGKLELTVEQSNPIYRMRVPVRLLVYPDVAETRWVDVSEPVTRISLSAPKLVQAVELDPEYRLWRRVDPASFPPILREIFVAPKAGLLVADDDLMQAARSLAERLLDTRPDPLTANGPSLPGNDPVLIVGRQEEVDRLLARLNLPPRPLDLRGKGSAQVWTARDPAGRPYAVISARDAEALNALSRPLPHYGRQSWLAFEAAKVTEKGIWPARAERIRVKAPNVM